MQRRITKELISGLTYEIIGAAIEVHKHLGPGLLERDYEKAFLYELDCIGLKYTTQQTINIQYKEIIIDAQMRYDVLVEGLIVVENKSVKELHPIFEATTLSYMKHLKIPKGILINYNVKNIFHEGQRTFVNEYFQRLPDE